MRASINHFEQSEHTFSTQSLHTSESWRDNVGNAFYRDIVEPIKQEAIEMKTAMNDLVNELELIKTEIDAI